MPLKDHYLVTIWLQLQLQRYAHPQGVSNNEFIPEVHFKHFQQKSPKWSFTQFCLQIYKASLSQPDLSIDHGGVYVQRGFAGTIPHLNIYRWGWLWSMYWDINTWYLIPIYGIITIYVTICLYRGNSRREQLQGASSSLERGHRWFFIMIIKW